MRTKTARSPARIKAFCGIPPGRVSVLRSERRWPSSDAPDCETHRSFFNRLDLRVQPLARRVGDPMVEVRQDVVQVPLDHPGYFDDGLQARMGRPEVPAPPVSQRPPLPPV